MALVQWCSCLVSFLYGSAVQVAIMVRHDTCGCLVLCLHVRLCHCTSILQDMYKSLNLRRTHRAGIVAQISLLTTYYDHFVKTVHHELRPPRKLALPRIFQWHRHGTDLGSMKTNPAYSNYGGRLNLMMGLSLRRTISWKKRTFQFLRDFPRMERRVHIN